jgi:beta-lactamase class A
MVKNLDFWRESVKAWVRMTKKKVRFDKTLLYGAMISIGLLTMLVGDSLKSMPMAPVAPVVQGIPINPDDWQSLADAVSVRASHFGGTVGYIIKDFRSGQTASDNSDLSFPSASLIKFPILCAAFQAVEEGKLSLSTPITLERGDKKGGSGILKLSPLGTVYTNRELLEYMIGHSDNTAAYLLVRQLGYDYLQKTFTQLGLQDTVITAEGFKLTSRRVEEDNMTSPRDMAYLLEKIYKRELVSAQASDQMLDILKHQHLRDRLPRFLPTGWEIAHKTGLLRRACHDVGIVFSPKGDYMICVLTSHDAAYKTAKRFISSVARITYDYYGRRGVPSGPQSS